ncbi:MAG: penicillin-binding transpeptidase domain-containing protein [Planctomycetota bacterium]|nr:penicillin-binding transpeptidase domain-containing protein [Planctomycetota bacterium]
MSLKVLIPSMFQRRVLLLGVLFVLSLSPLAAQLVRLTLAQGADLRLAAEARLTRSQETPTVRGRIVDRKGRVLAQDRPRFDLAVDYRVIDGTWATDQARRAAARAAGSAWGSLSRDQRQAMVDVYVPVYRVHLDRAWDRLAEVGGVSRAQLDRARDGVIAMVTRRQDAVTAARLEQERARVAASGRTPTARDERAMRRRAEAPILEKERAHVVIARVDDERGFRAIGVSEEQVELELPLADDRLSEARRLPVDIVPTVPGLSVRDSGERDYPNENVRVRIDRTTLPRPVASDEPLEIEVSGVACHILGTLRDTVFQSAAGDPASGTVDVLGDADRRREYLKARPEVAERARRGLGGDRGSYRDGDRIGAWGLEHTYENELRGLRGVRTTRVDTGEREFVPPEPGRDVRLTIDVDFQARVQALLDPRLGLARVQDWHKQESPTQPVGSDLAGAAVVLDVDTGDILALVSTPTYTREEWETQRERLAADLVGTPLVNRATGKYYTPGSIVKPLILVEAVARGKYDVSQAIACTGHLYERSPNAYRCWIYKRFQTTHSATLGHDPGAEEAIMVSCNIFFFTLGRRLGPEGVITAFRDFGVGSTFGLGVGGEAPGALGFDAAHPLLGIETGDATQMGIGQGPVTWTPLHAANAYATLARDGVWVQPRIVVGAARPEPRDLGLDPRAVRAAIEGLRASVGEHQGTGNHIATGNGEEPIFNVPGVRVWGKTGTAQAPRIFTRGEPRELLEEGDHSWFVVLAGRDRPRYAIAVVIDFGGSGGKVSGPIANQIIHALVAEGYL